MRMIWLFILFCAPVFAANKGIISIKVENMGDDRFVLRADGLIKRLKKNYNIITGVPTGKLVVTVFQDAKDEDKVFVNKSFTVFVKTYLDKGEDVPVGFDEKKVFSNKVSVAMRSIKNNILLNKGGEEWDVELFVREGVRYVPVKLANYDVGKSLPNTFNLGLGSYRAVLTREGVDSAFEALFVVGKDTQSVELKGKQIKKKEKKEKEILGVFKITSDFGDATSLIDKQTNKMNGIFKKSPGWVMIDFKRRLSLSAITITPYQAYDDAICTPSNIELFASLDGKKFFKIQDFRDTVKNEVKPTVHRLNKVLKTRFIKLVFKEEVQNNVGVRKRMTLSELGFTFAK
jgi:hypothetical protein